MGRQLSSAKEMAVAVNRRSPAAHSTQLASFPIGPEDSRARLGEGGEVAIRHFLERVIDQARATEQRMHDAVARLSETLAQVVDFDGKPDVYGHAPADVVNDTIVQGVPVIWGSRA